MTPVSTENPVNFTNRPFAKPAPRPFFRANKFLKMHPRALAKLPALNTAAAAATATTTKNATTTGQLAAPNANAKGPTVEIKLVPFAVQHQQSSTPSSTKLFDNNAASLVLLAQLAAAAAKIKSHLVATSAPTRVKIPRVVYPEFWTGKKFPWLVREEKKDHLVVPKAAPLEPRALPLAPAPVATTSSAPSTSPAKPTKPMAMSVVDFVAPVKPTKCVNNSGDEDADEDGTGQVLKCSFPGCKKTLSTKYSLRRHMKTHTKEKCFSCPECKREFSEKSSLKRHKLTHTGERPFKCVYPRCGRRFIDRGNMKKHLLRHVQEMNELVAKAKSGSSEACTNAVPVPSSAPTSSSETPMDKCTNDSSTETDSELDS